MPIRAVGNLHSSRSKVETKTKAKAKAKAKAKPQSARNSAVAPEETPKPPACPTPPNNKKANDVHSADQILRKGLCMLGVNMAKQQKAKKKTTNIDRFKAGFGADPSVWAQIWIDLQTTTITDAKIDVSVVGCNMTNFLITMNFLKRYPTETVQSNQFGPSENTIRKWRWYFLERLSALVDAKIKWPEEWNDQGTRQILCTVDGVHFQRNEPTHGKYSKNTKYYSHKFKTAAVNYEIAIDLLKSRVVHYRGPHPASHPDITIFREELIDKIPDGHFVIGDKGYRGEPTKIMTPNSHDRKSVRKFKGRARARHETFNKKLKRYECLDKRFIHGKEEQAICFEAVLVICQYEMDMGSPLFDV